LLPDGRPGAGSNDIAQAWLAEPTTRYAHGVLGDAVEAAALQARLRDGRVLKFRLPEDSVFEDLTVRVADLDGDGRDEMLVVRSRLQAGSSLMVLGARGGRIVALAETPPIGTANRWLNPLGAADVDGDGSPEVLAVLTPHIGGTLVVYGYAAGRLTEKWRLDGFSNHAIGSRELSLHAFLDVDGDGVLDVVLPSADRRALRVVRFAGGGPREIARHPLPAPVTGNFFLSGRTLRAPLAGGASHAITF
jgi:hypothetical protein